MTRVYVYTRYNTLHLSGYKCFYPQYTRRVLQPYILSYVRGLSEDVILYVYIYVHPKIVTVQCPSGKCYIKMISYTVYGIAVLYCVHVDVCKTPRVCVYFTLGMLHVLCVFFRIFRILTIICVFVLQQERCTRDVYTVMYTPFLRCPGNAYTNKIQTIHETRWEGYTPTVYYTQMDVCMVYDKRTWRVSDCNTPIVYNDVHVRLLLDPLYVFYCYV